MAPGRAVTSVGAQAHGRSVYQATAPVERPWGWYQVIAEAPGHLIKRIAVNPGQQISLQKHRQRSEHWVVVQGVVHVTLGEKELDLQVGQHADIAVGEVHRLANRTLEPAEILEVQFGAYLGEDDIVRLSDDYGRT